MTSKEEKEERKARLFIDKICYLSENLPDSVPLATKESKIFTAFSLPDGENEYHIFNRRFDAAFGKDTVNTDGSLKYMARGEFGMNKVAKYLDSLKDPPGSLASLPLDMMMLKFDRVLKGLLIVS